VKLPKVGSNAIVPVPHRDRAQQRRPKTKELSSERKWPERSSPERFSYLIMIF
jgi:hypothetical protein